MNAPRDRVRRILSDGVAGPVEPSSAAALQPGTERVRSLRSRLMALGLDRVLVPASAPEGADPAAWVVPDDDRPLREQVDGRVRETPLGPFLYVERRIPLVHAHGSTPLGDALRSGLPLREHERGPGGPPRLDPRDAVFLDTETTGLAGGTGTVAFLVGTGRVEDDAFVVRQYCMRDYPEEPALLHALIEDLGDAPLVTFNGRSFDWPLLVTRLRLHRLQAEPRPHLDLLPPARRLWADSVPSHTLATLETHVLGLHREGDLPGWRIPQAYFDYLRSGRAGLIALAFRHNELDVLSMLSLMGRIGDVLAAPTRPEGATPRDHLGTARLLLDLGRRADARLCLEAGVERAGPSAGSTLLRLLGHLCRREERYDEALVHFERLADALAGLDVEAHEQVAKIHEHRRRDYRAAIQWVERALQRVTPGTRAEAAFLHREQRLRRRLRAQEECPTEE